MLGIERPRAKGERLSLEQIRALLKATEEVEFEASDPEELYGRTLCEQEYWKQSKAEKRVLRAYVQKMSGLSRAQVTRLIAHYLKTGTVQERSYRRNRFPQRYTTSDIAVLAEVDEVHETLSGPATRKILQREFEHYGHQRYERLAEISAARIYNLRKSRRYRERRLRFEKTRPVAVAIGEWRRSDPQGRPRYVRGDRVHQGDLDGAKGRITLTRWMK